MLCKYEQDPRTMSESFNKKMTDRIDKAVCYALDMLPDDAEEDREDWEEVLLWIRSKN